MTRARRSGSRAPTSSRRPPGAEGWEQLYPYYLVFQDNLPARRRTQVLVLRQPALADGRSSPSRRSAVEFAVKCLGQYNTRHC